jgi:CBS domain-containing protein
MKVKDLMTRRPKTCAPDATLAEAARIMGTQNCGALPVVESGRTVAMVTDRDICLALARENGRPSELHVEDAMSEGVHFLRGDDPIGRALQLMRRWRVRRLPVLGLDGSLEGILTLNDVAMRAVPKGNENGGPSWDDLVRTLQAICERQRPTPPPPPKAFERLPAHF